MGAEQTPTVSQDNTQPTGRFVEAENDTVIDVPKRLVWLKKDTWQMTGKWMNWVQTRDFAKELNKRNYAGFKNWRMPTAVEAKSLFNKSQSNKDHMGEMVSVYSIFEPGFGFLCWTSDVRSKIQAVRFGYRRGSITYDDVYRVSRGASRFVRDIE